MRAMVVFESMFGNTHRVADAIADGMGDGAEVIVLDVVDAPADIPPDVELLVVGGPTHAFSMSRQTTREDAVRRGADPKDVPRGVREWLHALAGQSPQREFAAFDTRVNMPLVPGAASRSATRAARGLGFHVLKPVSFLVEGYEGPVVEGELARARDWGHSLTERLAG